MCVWPRCVMENRLFILYFIFNQFLSKPLPHMPIFNSSYSTANKDMMSKIWTNGDTIILFSRKKCGKRRNCSLRAILSFPTKFSKLYVVDASRLVSMEYRLNYRAYLNGFGENFHGSCNLAYTARALEFIAVSYIEKGAFRIIFHQYFQCFDF